MDNNNIVTVEQSVKRKRGSKSASISDNIDAAPGDIGRAVMESFQYFNLPIVSSDDECADRLNRYFSDCSRMDQLPTVEDMSLALGTTRKTVWEWENGNGCSVARSNMIKKAKQILAGIDAKLVSSGKIPQVVYIFRAKNFFDMSDQQQITIEAKQAISDQDAETVAAKYAELPD